MEYELTKLKGKLNSPDGQRLLKRCLDIYCERYSDKPINSLPYDKFKLIYKTGNRLLYQEEYLSRRERLALLQILTVHDDKYVDDLENVLCAICDEFTWIWPAHCLKNKDGGEFDYTVIDLYSSQTAFYLSETLLIFDEILSADIKYRIKISIKEKIIDNFENRTFWWETPLGTNWTSVCGGSVGIAYLYAFPERFDAVKDRIFTLMEDYLRGIHDDGVCEEGPSYFAYGFGFLCLFAEAYQQKTGEMPKFMRSRKIENSLNYYQNSILGGKYIQIGDQLSVDVKDYPVYELVIKKMFPSEFLLPSYDFIEQCPIDSKPLLTRILNGIGRYDNEKRRENRNKDFSAYYDKSEIFLFGNENYAFSAKGGNNHEMHNHNDVGAFCVIRNGKKIISDYGLGEYTWEYFNDSVARYGEKIFVCGSLSHSVPIIDGEYQKFGYEYKADYINSDKNSVEFNIAKAYGLFNERL
ncbi:MAG: heparinase II/III family protein, partial [Clostridia bacterium]|nr:heparinase II/III family protein [Clostridia bacterium]